MERRRFAEDERRYERKFPQARAMYAYMMLHPGKS